MSRVIYEVVEHDGGWAYRVAGSFSETFASHERALKAARRAAQEHKIPGDTRVIAYQDQAGIRHEETDRGDDRPSTSVNDPGQGR
ncbi:MAG: DUF2188 domain-containing protein [Hyphomicrobiales bacterium]|nr:DUF2188 domain-containing protein [Hyphomicrobiales bacterium]